MSESLDRTSEIAKLARLLGVEPTDLAYLETVPSQALTGLRAQVTDRMFAGDAGRLRRVAAASKLVPVPLTVKISQLAFGPVLCAATAGLLEPAHAVKIASKVPTGFLADIAVHIDPRRAPDVIAAVPVDIVVRVAVEMLRRGEHVAMGRFVNYLPLRTLRAAVPQIRDEADLLRVAFVMEGKTSLDDLLDIARDRIPALIDAAHRHDMWGEALDLITHLNPANLAEIAACATDQDDEVLDSLVRSAHRIGAWDALLPLTAALDERSLARFAAVPAVAEPEILDDILTAALAGSLWLDLLPMTLALDAPARARLAALPAFTRPEVVRSAVAAAAEHDLWEALLPLADSLPGTVAPLLLEALEQVGDGVASPVPPAVFDAVRARRPRPRPRPGPGSA